MSYILSKAVIDIVLYFYLEKEAILAEEKQKKRKHDVIEDSDEYSSQSEDDVNLEEYDSEKDPDYRVRN